MKQVRFEYDGNSYSIDVEEPSKIEKIHLAARAPDSLHEVADSEPENIERHIDQEVIDFLMEVTADYTNFEREHLEAMPTDPMLQVTSAVLEAVLGEPETEHSRRRLKRVRATKGFIEVLFAGKAAVVAGMPDDARLEGFDYDPSRNELQFIFSSDEWEPIDEGAAIPVHQAGVVELGDDVKEI